MISCGGEVLLQLLHFQAWQLERQIWRFWPVVRKWLSLQRNPFTNASFPRLAASGPYFKVVSQLLRSDDSHMGGSFYKSFIFKLVCFMARSQSFCLAVWRYSCLLWDPFTCPSFPGLMAWGPHLKAFRTAVWEWWFSWRYPSTKPRFPGLAASGLDLHANGRQFEDNYFHEDTNPQILDFLTWRPKVEISRCWPVAWKWFLFVC